MVKNKVFHFFIILSTVSAWTYFLVLLAAYSVATISLGRIPSYGYPDPKYFSFYEPFEFMLNISGNIWLVSSLFWLTFNFLIIKENLNYFKSKAFLLGAMGQFLAVVIFFSDINNWWMD